MTAPQAQSERTMDRFIIRENIKHYIKLLERATDEKLRAQLCSLLAEEQRKQKAREAEAHSNKGA